MSNPPSVEPSGRRAAEPSRTVLVVDGDPDIQRWVVATLEPHGCRVARAVDVLTGVSMVRTVRPDVIVLDLDLPGGGGKVFLERLRTFDAFKQTPVLVLTAEVSPRIASQLQALGIAGILEKPVNARLFVHAILRAFK
ncbi:MAG: response regulator [Gemmatimonadales bacterium]